MASPTRESHPHPLPPVAQPFHTIYPTSITTQLHAPPSPHTHRVLRKLQSAHNLGSVARTQNQNSLMSQQVLQEVGPSPPSHRSSLNRSPQRNRANSDAATPPSAFPNNILISLNSKRTALSRATKVADTMSLDRLIREGPPNGDVVGALASARMKVLDQGIKSDGDGMVRLSDKILQRPN